MSQDIFNQKFGSLVQFGVQYMAGFSAFADMFIIKHAQYKPEIDSFGYSRSYEDWKESNKQSIMDLHDALDSAGLIPVEPI